jgi:hypothetical protein
VRVSFCAQQVLPFRIEVPLLQGLRCYHGATADAAASAALCDVGSPRGLVAQAIEPEGEGPYVDALREWIERVTPAAEEPSRPALRLVR